MIHESNPATPRPTPASEDDRRQKRRFAIQQETRYRLHGANGASEYGSARTINISSSGVLIDAPTPLPQAMRIELTINWPALMDGLSPMKLLVFGRVARSNAQGTAIKIERYELVDAGSKTGTEDPLDPRALAAAV